MADGVHQPLGSLPRHDGQIVQLAAERGRIGSLELLVAEVTNDFRKRGV